MKSWQPRLEDKKKRKVFADSLSSRNEMEKTEPSVDVDDWLDKLGLLFGVPFNYLIPDINMLPEESIRFFYIDNNWIKNLQDGACSIGQNSEKNYNLKNIGMLTGFLLRSAIVEAWPGLEVTGRDNKDITLMRKRMERLSSSVMLCIFEGEIFSLSIQIPAESLHFAIKNDKVEYRNEKMRVVDIEGLASNLSSAEFASKMMVDGERIVFEIDNPKNGD